MIIMVVVPVINDMFYLNMHDLINKIVQRPHYLISFLNPQEKDTRIS